MRRLRTGESGATLVETGIVLVIAILLMMAIVDFGRYVAVSSSVKTAAREATRYGSSVGDSVNAIPRFTDCDEIAAAGSGRGAATDFSPSDFSIVYDHGPGTAVFSNCPVGGPTPDPATIADGDRIEVTVTQSFVFVSPVSMFFGPVNVTSVDRRTIQQP